MPETPVFVSQNGFSTHPNNALIRAGEILGSMALVTWLIAGTYFPVEVFRSLAGVLPAVASLLVLFSCHILRYGIRIRTEIPFIFFYLFILFGLFSIVLSFLDIPQSPGLPRENRFIIRQSYFIIFLPLLLVAGAQFWRLNLEFLIKTGRRFFYPVSILLMISDWSLAFFLGDPLFVKFNSYNIYIEKGTIWIIFSFLYFSKITEPSRWPVAPVIILIIYFFGSQFLYLGSLFNATTGILLFILLLVASLLIRLPILFAQGFMIIIGIFFASLFTATVAPYIFKSDLNALWRFNGWRENFEMLVQSKFLGVGFGVPYFKIGPDALERSLKYVRQGTEPWVAGGGLFDLSYIRAQHNSFMNVFYRTGIFGGTSFFLFNASLLLCLLAKLRRDLADGYHESLAPLLIAMGLLSIGIVEISLHVGLETPRFLVTYGLAAALAAYVIILPGGNVRTER